MPGRLTRGRLRQALRAGCAALLAGLLCTAALAAPALSTQDFGHRHADGTPGHLHPVASVVGGTPAPAPVAGLAVARLSRPVQRSVPTAVGRAAVRQPRSRGPPGST